MCLPRYDANNIHSNRTTVFVYRQQHQPPTWNTWVAFVNAARVYIKTRYIPAMAYHISGILAYIMGWLLHSVATTATETTLPYLGTRLRTSPLRTVRTSLRTVLQDSRLPGVSALVVVGTAVVTSESHFRILAWQARSVGRSVSLDESNLGNNP